MTQAALTIKDTTLGKKYLMAASGVVLFGFVFGHMLGNLQVFIGAQAMNDYAHFLQTTPALLWGTRFVVLASIVVHFGTAMSLVMQNRAARPVRYRVKKTVATSVAAKSMAYGGVALLLYIVFHLLHFTVTKTAGPIAESIGYTHSTAFGVEQIPNVYNNVVYSFQNAAVTGVYLVAQLCLGMHLYHGSRSIFQSLGLSHRKYNESVRSVSLAFAVVVVLGFISVPLAVFVGIVQPV